jgi:phosphohistidine phosphatase
LLLVRHAKATKGDAGVHDRDRPLDDRGRRDAPKMGQRLAEREARPDLILASPALRALETAQLLAGALGYRAADIQVDERLYASTPVTMLSIIQGLDDTLKRVMLVGHNPEMSELAHRFSGEIGDMPTCSVAEFEFASTTWAEVGRIVPARATLAQPKE